MVNVSMMFSVILICASACADQLQVSLRKNDVISINGHDKTFFSRQRNVMVGNVSYPCEYIQSSNDFESVVQHFGPVEIETKGTLQSTIQEIVPDFARLCFYESKNAGLPPGTERRIVFLGDSITQGWNDERSPLFLGSDAINRGIGGQTTPQILLRFKADVLDLKPAVVHILAGTNDIAGNTGPTTLSRMQSNVQMMVELAKAHGIHVIVGSILPASKYPWNKEPWNKKIDPSPTIEAMNKWILAYASEQHFTYVDYYAELVDKSDINKGLRKELTIDGVHLNLAGYAIMNDTLYKAFRDDNFLRTLLR